MKKKITLIDYYNTIFLKKLKNYFKDSKEDIVKLEENSLKINNSIRFGETQKGNNGLLLQSPLKESFPSGFLNFYNKHTSMSPSGSSGINKSITTPMTPKMLALLQKNNELTNESPKFQFSISPKDNYSPSIQ